jgi:hypothetical protein
MKKIIISVLSLALLLSVYGVNAQSSRKNREVNDKEDFGWNSRGGHHVPGIWTAYIENDKVYMELTGDDWSTGRIFSLTELGTLPEGNEGHFTVTREAGTITYTGIFAGGKGKGFYKFAQNEAFKTYLQQKGYTALDKDLLLQLFLTDIGKNYFEYLKANGYAAVSNKQLNDLAYQGITHKVLDEYFNLFKTEGYGHQSIDEIVTLREHGVNAGFVNSFHQMGYKNIPLDRVLSLRDHGVDPGFIAQFTKMGYKNISLDEAQELRDHGVNPEFIERIQQMGYKNITLDKARELQDHGVNPQFIESIKALGFKEISLEQAQQLVDHGVNASYIQKMKGKNANVHTLDDYIRLRDTGND